MGGPHEVVSEVVRRLANGVAAKAGLKQRMRSTAAAQAPVDPISETVGPREDGAEEERVAVDDGSGPFASHGVVKLPARVAEGNAARAQATQTKAPLARRVNP